MKEITPYKTVAGLIKAIDNGGRFYNLFSRAGDDVVTKGELAKAAGVFSSSDTAMLFLEMAQYELSPSDQAIIEQILEPKLRDKYAQRRPQTMLPSAVDSQGAAGTPVVVSGYPRFVENKTDFNWYLMVPIVSAKSTCLMMKPIYDLYDVYEIFDNQQMQAPSSVIAKSRGIWLDHHGPIRYGGILRTMNYKKDKPRDHKLFLEAAYYTRLPAKNE